ncbi:hypothetical protein E4U42_001530 [Claviceps africana]|uniref:Uncharacterized protein n=1 Tax=Claviceps africana TaxID=83212 RepID=A0A8K0J9Q7_9HYPO|nr:hypothetical protein E4U42_001530 [Claviceps africana]
MDRGGIGAKARLGYQNGESASPGRVLVVSNKTEEDKEEEEEEEESGPTDGVVEDGERRSGA